METIENMDNNYKTQTPVDSAVRHNDSGSDSSLGLNVSELLDNFRKVILEPEQRLALEAKNLLGSFSIITNDKKQAGTQLEESKPPVTKPLEKESRPILLRAEPMLFSVQLEKTELSESKTAEGDWLRRGTTGILRRPDGSTEITVFDGSVEHGMRDNGERTVTLVGNANQVVEKYTTSDGVHFRDQDGKLLDTKQNIVLNERAAFIYAQSRQLPELLCHAVAIEKLIKESDDGSDPKLRSEGDRLAIKYRTGANFKNFADQAKDDPNLQAELTRMAAKQLKEHYELCESARLRELDARTSKFNTTDWVPYAVSVLAEVRNFELDSKGTSIGVAGLERIISTLPGVHIPQLLSPLLKATEEISIKGDQVKVKCKCALAPADVPFSINLVDPQFNFSFDKSDRNRLSLTKMEGIYIGSLKMTSAEVTFSEEPACIKFKPKFANPYLPQRETVIPLANAQQVRELRASFEQLPKAKDEALAQLALVSDKIGAPVIKQLLGAAEGVSKKGDEITISNEKPQEISVGPLKLKIDKEIGAKLELKTAPSDKSREQASSVCLTNIKGVTVADLPIPKELGKSIGLDSKMAVSKIELSAAEGKNDTRKLTLAFDNGTSITMQLDRDGKPQLYEDGKWAKVEATVSTAHGKVELRLWLDFKSIEKGDPNFEIEVLSNRAAFGEIAKKLLPGDFGPAAQVLDGIENIKKDGVNYTVERASKTNFEMSKVQVHAGEKIRFSFLQKDGCNILEFGSDSGLSITTPNVPYPFSNILPISQEKLAFKSGRIASNADGTTEIFVSCDKFIDSVGLSLKDGKPDPERLTVVRLSDPYDKGNFKTLEFKLSQEWQPSIETIKELGPQLLVWMSGWKQGKVDGAVVGYAAKGTIKVVEAAPEPSTIETIVGLVTGLVF